MLGRGLLELVWLLIPSFDPDRARIILLLS